MPTKVSPGDTQVARWHAGRHAAFIMYFDDGLKSQLDHAIPALTRRRLVGTFYLCPEASWYAPLREVWETQIPATGMEYAAHTLTHSGVTSYDQADREIGGSGQYVRRINPASDTSPLQSYCKPGGLKPGRWEITDAQHVELMRKHHLIHRPSGIPDAAGKEIYTADEMFALVEGALAEGRAGYITFHGVGGDWLSADLDEFYAFLDRLAAVTDRVWVAGHMPIHKYAVERDSARAEVLSAGDDAIRIRLTCDADATLYDQPLTLITAVPAAWTAAQICQGGTISTVAVEDGRAQYQALPGAEEIVITPQSSRTQPSPEPSRVEALAAMLSDQPVAPAAPIGRRDVWDRLAATEPGQEFVERVRAHADEALPAMTDGKYLAFTQTGNRRVWDEAIHANRRSFSELVLAECLADSGEFLPAIRAHVDSICDETTWVMSAHDHQLKNFRGEAMEIDLMVAMTAHDLATAAGLLGDRLDEGTRERICREIDRRAWQPFEAMCSGSAPPNWWMEGTNNWNAVCLSGVVGSALMMEPSRQRRAEFLEAMERSLPNFLEGFGTDGYCSEGIGYWNYGFSHFLVLSDVCYRATGGRLDLLADERAQRAALYPWRLRLAEGVYPAFADCHRDASAGKTYVAYIAARMLPGGPGNGPATPACRVHEDAVFCLGDPEPVELLVDPGQFIDPLRGWFDEAGVLVCRPAAEGAATLAVAAKGGHNGEHHNHNDVGSYTVAVGDVCVLADPGAEVYTRRTFSPHRYDSKLLNSYGHPVPVVDGQLQKTAGDARAKVLRTDFTDARDELVLDLAGAYQLDGLESLTRTFQYSREAGGSLAVVDEVSFAEPQTFETALITYGQWKRLDDGGLVVTLDGRAVQISIDAGEADFEIAAETIDEQTHSGRQPTRLGIALARAVRAARVAMTIAPVAAE